MWTTPGSSYATTMIIWDQMHKNMLLKRCLSLMLAVLMLAMLTACKEQPVQDEMESYSITVTSQAGEPLENVKVFVYEDPTLSELVSVATTDTHGRISFMEKPRDAFVAILKDVPSGYAVEELYTISMGDNQITLASRALTPEELASIRYGLGDRLGDLSVTDCDGIKHNLSDLLQQKKAVVLNFWYLNCNPCKMEFPYLQQAFEAYGEEVAFLALNPVDGTNETVSSYRWEQGLTFPVASCDPVFQKTFGVNAYPTTLILDRSGTICLSHTGMFTDSAALCNALKYFTQENYEQRIFETIDEIPEV